MYNSILYSLQFQIFMYCIDTCILRFIYYLGWLYINFHYLHKNAFVCFYKIFDTYILTCFLPRRYSPLFH